MIFKNTATAYFNDFSSISNLGLWCGAVILLLSLPQPVRKNAPGRTFK